MNQNTQISIRKCIALPQTPNFTLNASNASNKFRHISNCTNSKADTVTRNTTSRAPLIYDTLVRKRYPMYIHTIRVYSDCMKKWKTYEIKTITIEIRIGAPFPPRFMQSVSWTRSQFDGPGYAHFFPVSSFGCYLRYGAIFIPYHTQ